MTRSVTRVAGATIAAAALLMSACTSSDDAEEASPTDPADVESGAANDTSTTADTESESTATGAESTELTASFRGVTEDTIEIGFVDVDFERLNSEFGIELDSPDTGLIMEALIEDLNTRGGINGRQIDVVVEKFLPIGATTAEEACVKMVEDEEVFAVLGGFAGPGAEGANVCITGSGETVLVGGVITDERLAQSQAPWVTPEMNATRRGPAFVDALEQSGELAALGALGVHAVSADQDPAADVLRDALVDAGATVALRTTGEAADDPAATASDTELMLERARVDGVESIVVVGVNPTATDTILAADEFTVVLPSTEEVANLDQSTFTEGDRLIGTGSIPQADDPALTDCLEIARTALDEAATPPPEESDDDLSYWISTLRACRNLALFEAVATEAGADLTNESFQEALGSVELPPLPVYSFASVGPDKPDARDTLSVLEWDADVSAFVEIAGPFDVAE